MRISSAAPKEEEDERGKQPVETGKLDNEEATHWGVGGTCCNKAVECQTIKCHEMTKSLGGKLSLMGHPHPPGIEGEGTRRIETKAEAAVLSKLEGGAVVENPASVFKAESWDEETKRPPFMQVEKVGEDCTETNVGSNEEGKRSKDGVGRRAIVKKRGKVYERHVSTLAPLAQN